MWEDDKLTWFDNPPRKGRKGKSRSRRRPPKGYKSWSSWSRAMRAKKKGARKMARRSRKKLYGAAAAAHAKARRRGGRKATRRRTTHRAASRPRRRYRRSTAKSASRAGRVLRYRRPNPPIVNQLVDGLKDAGLVVVGDAGTNIVAGLIPFGAGSVPLDLAKKLVAALAVGYAGKFISGNASKMFLIGGLSGIIRSAVKQYNVPVLAPALSDFYAPANLAVGAYPQVPGGVSSYPQALMAGDDEDIIYS